MRGIDHSVAPVIWSGVFWVLAVLAISAAVYLTVRLVTDRRADALGEQSAAAPAAQVEPATSARAILSERLARGEIDVDEYKQRLEALDQ